MRGCYHQQARPVVVALGVFLFLFAANRIINEVGFIRKPLINPFTGLIYFVAIWCNRVLKH